MNRRSAAAPPHQQCLRRGAEAAREHARAIVATGGGAGWRGSACRSRFGLREAGGAPLARSRAVLCGRSAGLGAAVALEHDGSHGDRRPSSPARSSSGCSPPCPRAGAWQLDAPEHDDGDEGGGGGAARLRGPRVVRRLRAAAGGGAAFCALARWSTLSGGPLRATLSRRARHRAGRGADDRSARAPTAGGHGRSRESRRSAGAGGWAATKDLRPPASRPSMRVIRHGGRYGLEESITILNAQVGNALLRGERGRGHG